MCLAEEVQRYHESLAKLCTWLKRERPANILMPLVQAEKRPKFCHKDGRWTWKDYDARTLEAGASVGILMQDLFCLDIDNVDLRAHLGAEHPSWFEERPVEVKTAHGHHVVWARSDLCEQLGLFDGSRQLDPKCVPEQFLDDRGDAPLDIKTRTSTGTGGVLVVAPTVGKSWIVAPWETTLLPVPDEVVEWIQRNKKRSGNGARRWRWHPTGERLGPRF